MAFIVVTVSWVNTYLQTHQIVYIKYLKLFVHQLHLNKVIFLKKLLEVQGKFKQQGYDLISAE